MKQSETMPLIIYGCGGHARSVADVALHNGIDELIFVDDNARDNERLFNFKVVRELPSHTQQLIIAVGDNQKRACLLDQFSKNNLSVINLSAHTAYVSKYSQLMAKGIFIAHGAHIGPHTRIGTGSILNTHCVVEHDCHIGNYSHISVNATVAGNCSIGDFVTIGAGATVIDGVKISAQVTIGAGAVVVADIDEAGTYVGIPARRLSLAAL